MSKKKVLTKELRKIKELVEEGKVEIQNDAFKAGPNSVRVRGFANDRTRGGLELSWSRDGVGFGALTMCDNGDGRLRVDMEGMSDEFCIEVFTQALKEAKRR